jgi:hypothetical protein
MLTNWRQVTPPSSSCQYAVVPVYSCTVFTVIFVDLTNALVVPYDRVNRLL